MRLQVLHYQPLHESSRLHLADRLLKTRCPFDAPALSTPQSMPDTLLPAIHAGVQTRSQFISSFVAANKEAYLAGPSQANMCHIVVGIYRSHLYFVWVYQEVIGGPPNPPSLLLNESYIGSGEVYAYALQISITQTTFTGSFSLFCQLDKVLQYTFQSIANATIAEYPTGKGKETRYLLPSLLYTPYLRLRSRTQRSIHWLTS